MSRGASGASRRSFRTSVHPALRYGFLFAVGALLSGVTILWGINPHDEGLVLQAGARIADGQLPYRDFYANYGPGQYFLVGGLDALFGPSLLSWRIVRVALDATVGVLAYALARRDAPEPLALAAWLAVAGAMAFSRHPHPNPAAIALGLGAILLARRSPAGAGALAGVAIVFRIDVGIAAAAGAALAAAPAGGRRAAISAAATAALVGALLLAPVVIAAPAGPKGRRSASRSTSKGSSACRSRAPTTAASSRTSCSSTYFPYVLLGGAALWTLLALLRRAPLRTWAPAPLALVGVGYLLARADLFHLIPLAAVLPILLATGAERERRTGHALPRSRWRSSSGLIVLHGLDRKRIQALHPPPLSALEIDVADGVRAPTAEARSLGKLVRYVRARVGPGEPVFVANPRYDLVKVGNPLVYVLLDQPNPALRRDAARRGYDGRGAARDRRGPGACRPESSWSAGSRRWPRRRSKRRGALERGADSRPLSGPQLPRGSPLRGLRRAAPPIGRPSGARGMTDAHRRDMPRGLRDARTWYRGVDPTSQVDPALVDFVARHAGRRVLDLGAGLGGYSHALGERGLMPRARRQRGVRGGRRDRRTRGSLRRRAPAAGGRGGRHGDHGRGARAPGRAGDLLDEAARVAGRNVLTTPNCTQRFPAATIEFSHMLDVDHRRFFTEALCARSWRPGSSAARSCRATRSTSRSRTGAPASADEHVRAPRARRRRSAAVLLAAAGAGLGGPRGRRVTRVLVVSVSPSAARWRRPPSGLSSWHGCSPSTAGSRWPPRA